MTASPSGEVGSSGMCSFTTSGSTFDPTIRRQVLIISIPKGLTNGIASSCAIIASAMRVRP